MNTAFKPMTRGFRCQVLIPVLAALTVTAPLPRHASAADLTTIGALAVVYDRHAAAAVALGGVDLEDAAAVSRITRDLRRTSGRDLAVAWAAKLAVIGAQDPRFLGGIEETVRRMGVRSFVDRLQRDRSFVQTIPGAREATATMQRWARHALEDTAEAAVHTGIQAPLRLLDSGITLALIVIVMVMLIVTMQSPAGLVEFIPLIEAIAEAASMPAHAVADAAEDAVAAAEGAFEEVVDEVSACLEAAARKLDDCLDDAILPISEAACDGQYLADTAACLAGQ